MTSQQNKILTLRPVRNKDKGGDVAKLGRKTVKTSHPIDQRLVAMGKSRAWLAAKVGRTEQSIGLYCNRKQVLWPGSVVTKRICHVLEVNLDFLILGLQGPAREKTSQCRNNSQKIVQLLPTR